MRSVPWASPSPSSTLRVSCLPPDNWTRLIFAVGTLAQRSRVNLNEQRKMLSVPLPGPFWGHNCGFGEFFPPHEAWTCPFSLAFALTLRRGRVLLPLAESKQRNGYGYEVFCFPPNQLDSAFDLGGRSPASVPLWRERTFIVPSPLYARLFPHCSLFGFGLVVLRIRFLVLNQCLASEMRRSLKYERISPRLVPFLEFLGHPCRTVTRTPASYDFVVSNLHTLISQ